MLFMVAYFMIIKMQYIFLIDFHILFSLELSVNAQKNYSAKLLSAHSFAFLNLPNNAIINTTTQLLFPFNVAKHSALALF